MVSDSNQEIFSLEELVKHLMCGTSASLLSFDINKLKWFNGQYIRAMSLEEFHKHAEPYLSKAITNKNIDLLKVSKLLQARTEVLSEIPRKSVFE